jgi:ribose transport system permease protein
MTAAVFLFSAIFARGSVDVVSLRSMIPFASVLAIAAVGQSMVIQQRGIDLSGAGVISLSAIIVSVYPHGSSSRLGPALLISLMAAVVVGLINGGLVRLGLVPIIVTLAMYELLAGVVQSYSHGIAQYVPSNLTNFSTGSVGGIPNPLIVAAVLVVVTTIFLRLTVVGRRFVDAGINRSAALAQGTRVSAHIIGSYLVSSMCYWLAGVVLAGYLVSPTTSIGDTYLLAPIAVVVLAGNSFGMTKMSIIGSALGALFYTQLIQFTLSLGAGASSQLYIQSLGIMALPVARWAVASLRRTILARRLNKVARANSGIAS